MYNLSHYCYNSRATTQRMFLFLSWGVRHWNSCRTTIMQCKVLPLIFMEREELNCETLCKVFSLEKKTVFCEVWRGIFFSPMTNSNFLCSLVTQLSESLSRYNFLPHHLKQHIHHPPVTQAVTQASIWHWQFTSRRIKICHLGSCCPFFELHRMWPSVGMYVQYALHTVCNSLWRTLPSCPFNVAT